MGVQGRRTAWAAGKPGRSEGSGEVRSGHGTGAGPGGLGRPAGRGRDGEGRGSGRPGNQGVNSRIVIIIFETENLFFPRAGAIRLFSWEMGGGLRVVPSLRIVIRGPPRVNPPRGFGSAEGYVRRAVGVALSGFRFPVRPVPALSPAVQGLLAASPAAAPLCRPCPQVPVSLHAPASCSAWRKAAVPRSMVHGPWSMVLPRTLMPSERRGWRGSRRRR